jgi:hypothetical protein
MRKKEKVSYLKVSQESHLTTRAHKYSKRFFFFMVLCMRCGAKNPKEPCEKKDCPYRLLYASVKRPSFEGKESYSGQTPNVFIGRKGYPNVHAGILSSEFVDEDSDSPSLWAEKKYQIPTIMQLRGSLVNSRFSTSITSFSQRYVGMVQEVAMAKQAVSLDVTLDKKPTFKLRFSDEVTPFGPTIGLKKAELTENPSVPVSVEKAVGDTDLKASDALTALYKKDIDEHYLTKLLSAGTLGVKRKMVPTRWSITAVDDTLGKKMISDIKNCQTASYQVFFGGYLGNYYLILFFPEVWSYELFETYVPKTPSVIFPTMTDYESYDGRKEYADDTAGGYYAARLGILEHLSLIKRQASVIAFRFITDAYTAPLGVWVVRTAVRHAMSERPLQFSSRQEMLAFSRDIAWQRFNYDLSYLEKKSVFLKGSTQRKITGYFA